MDTLNNAIETLTTSSSKEDWPSVNMNVADATVTVISEKVRRNVDVGGLSGLQVWGIITFHDTSTHSQDLTPWEVMLAYD